MARFGLVSCVAVLLISALSHAQPAAPTHLVVLGVSPTEHSLAWQDNATDETGYRMERSTNGGAWTQFTTTGPSKDTFPRHRVTVTSTTDRYRYRIRACRDSTCSAYSNVYAAPRWVERPNVRAFFNTTDCPGAPPPEHNCAPAATDAAGENEMAARTADILQGALGEFRLFNFRDPDLPPGADREPVNLVWSDGGGAHGSDGIRVGPGILGAYDHTTNTGDVESIIVPVHEFFHAIQGAYGYLKREPAAAWYAEGHARAIQDLVCIPVQGNTCVNVDDDIGGGPSSFHGQVNEYLGNPNRPLTELSYSAVLFWTYLCEQFGLNRTEPRLGLDLIAEFYAEGERDLDRDGISVVGATLANLGHSHDFVSAFKRFVVANYAKDLTGSSVPTHYQYADERQPGATAYRRVRRSLNVALGNGDQVGPSLSDVTRWGARYFRIQPAAAVPTIQADFKVDSAHPVYFTLFAVRGGNIIREFNDTGKSFSQTVANDSYDEIAIVVAGLQHDANFRYSINASAPTLQILDPLGARPVRVGSFSAPEKFLVKLQVLSQTADPVTGIPANDFAFTVGTQPVPAANVVTSAYVQGQYWFVLQAPAQTASGTYDLGVTWSTLADTEAAAVNYAAVSGTENVVIVDRSGSMLSPPPPAASKLVDAKKAAKIYVDSWRSGDKIGVVSFANDASANLTLRSWNDTSRNAAHTAIDQIPVTGGGTSIGAGLEKGLDELVARGSLPSWAMVLLSDGMNTTGDNIKDFFKTYRSRQAAGEQVPEVHTVAIGADANRPDLQELAIKTGGTYHFAAEPPGASASLAAAASAGEFWQDVSELFRVVSERIVREGQVLSATGATQRGGTSIHSFPVDAGASELVVAVGYRWGWPSIALRDPGNVLHPPFLSTGGADGHRVYRIASPLPGSWQVEMGVSPTCEEFCESDYLVEASVKSELTMELYLGLAAEERVEGTPMPILVSLTESEPVLGAQISGRITLPSGSEAVVSLFDDGNHQDGAADDGIYGTTFRQTFEPGSYQVVVQAQGATPEFGPFARRLRESFHLSPDLDEDGDSLPDGYERRVGLDPTRDDAAEDPDRDGLDNGSELIVGTHPLDPDSDDGGESDGSEDLSGRDPNEAGDDVIGPPRVSAYAGVGEVMVRFNAPPNVVAYDVFRAEDPDPENDKAPSLDRFTLHRMDVPASDPYSLTDRDVQNGTQYWYLLVSIGSGGEGSGPSEPAAATPRADPYAPHGALWIDDAAPCTRSPEVSLTLFASDRWEPESRFADPRSYDPQAQTSLVADMQLSNRSDFAEATWEPYVPTRAWTLDPDSSGSATVYVRYRDHAGNVSVTYHASTLVDEGCNAPPDCAGATSSSDELAPPNHKLREVSVVGVTDPDGDLLTISISSVLQDEPVEDRGDGRTCPDGIVSGGTAWVRAERSGKPKAPGDGRVYHIGFSADDGRGGTCDGEITVCVPHDRRPESACVDQGPLYDSTTCE